MLLKEFIIYHRWEVWLNLFNFLRYDWVEHRCQKRVRNSIDCNSLKEFFVLLNSKRSCKDFKLCDRILFVIKCQIKWYVLQHIYCNHQLRNRAFVKWYNISTFHRVLDTSWVSTSVRVEFSSVLLRVKILSEAKGIVFTSFVRLCAQSILTFERLFSRTAEECQTFWSTDSIRASL
jgi:hypothetical protein